MTVTPTPIPSPSATPDQVEQAKLVVRKPRLRRRTPGEKIFNVVNIVVLTGFALMCLIPFVHVIGSSFATPGELATSNFVLIPKEWTVAAWQ